jgi:hypothetical protein
MSLNQWFNPFPLLASISGTFDASDHDIIERARAVIADSVMLELGKEDPLSQEELRNAARHQVVAFTQKIRVCLLVLNKLMDFYTSLPKPKY